MTAEIAPVRKRPRWPVWARRLRLALLTAVLLAFTLLVIVPFAWMLLMSVKTTSEILLSPYGLPKTVRWHNYVELMTNPRIRFYRHIVNSAIVTFGAMVICTTLATMGGYGFGRPRFHFRLRGLLFAALLFALVLPPQVSYIPQYIMMARYGLINTRWVLILLYAAMGLPVSVYLMATYFEQLPSELEDAARLDGCNEFRTFSQVMLPMARPALATVLLLNFLSFWNELLLAVTMVTSPALRTLPSAIFHFIGDNASEYGMAACTLVVSMLPVLILYMLLSERFIEGMTAGAIKG